MDYKIFWTDEAIHNLEEIIDYLRHKWTEKEVENFKTKLSRQIDLISTNPTMFPISTHVFRLRKAVLSKQTSIFYEIKDHHIYLAYLFVQKKDISKIK
jgi:plasmid stabilization system protein ParE